MRMSWKLGRVAGIDLYLHPTFLFVLALAGSYGGGLIGVALVAAVFGCILLHEFGHALTARRFGIQTEDITLYPIGGVARLRSLPRSPTAELLITLAGPAVNVAIAAALAGLLALGKRLAPDPSPLTAPADFLGELMVLNIGLAVFNMIPAFPMDGGRVLRALLASPFGRLRATEIAAGVGQILAVVMGVYFVSQALQMHDLHMLMPALLTVFIYWAAGMERARVRHEERAHPLPPADAGIWTAPPGYQWVAMGDGAWQLAPIVVTNHHHPYDMRYGRPWH
jgi:Zn-dependent protease